MLCRKNLGSDDDAAGSVPVYLNVYDLTPINSYAYWLGFGVYHSGIQGSADLGVCLHTSPSGLDLPMKVVDMFGCGLLVCAVAYSCMKELVKVDKNGLFSSSSELADELMSLFEWFPDERDPLKSLREGALVYSSSWQTEWQEHAKPLISEVISQKLE